VGLFLNRLLAVDTQGSDVRARRNFNFTLDDYLFARPDEHDLTYELVVDDERQMHTGESSGC